MNLLHDIPITTDNFKNVNCIIEVPKDTSTKYQYDDKLEMFELTDCLVSSLKYPINYGFIPQTLTQGPEWFKREYPLDVLVFNHDAIDRGALVKCRILGVLEFEDSGSIDNKILAVPSWSPPDKYSKIEDIEEAHLKIYKHFFRICKLAHSSNTQVAEWQSATEALTVIKESHQRWEFKRERPCRDSGSNKTAD